MKDIKSMMDTINPKYPFVFIDVGAMGGIPRQWRTLEDSIKVIGFEPDDRELKKLRKDNHATYFNYALHDKSEDLRYFVTKGPGLSSIFRPNQHFLSQFEDVDRFDVIREETLPASRIKNLDAVLKENDISDVDFIKVDTQGSELAILEGAQRDAIVKVFGVQVEVEFVEMYKGQPFFYDVDIFLRKNGFELIDVKRYYWKRKDYHDYTGKGQLIFGDALYFKNIEILLKGLSAGEDSAYQEAKVRKSIAICMIYRMWDYAASILSEGWQKGIISETDRRETFAAIKRFSRRGVIPSFPGKKLFYSVANRLAQKMTPPSYLGWADSDRFLGNTKDI